MKKRKKSLALLLVMMLAFVSLCPAAETAMAEQAGEAEIARESAAISVGEENQSETQPAGSENDPAVEEADARQVLSEEDPGQENDAFGESDRSKADDGTLGGAQYAMFPASVTDGLPGEAESEDGGNAQDIAPGDEAAEETALLSAPVITMDGADVSMDDGGLWHACVDGEAETLRFIWSADGAESFTVAMIDGQGRDIFFLETDDTALSLTAGDYIEEGPYALEVTALRGDESARTCIAFEVEMKDIETEDAGADGDESGAADGESAGEAEESAEANAGQATDSEAQESAGDESGQASAGSEETADGNEQTQQEETEDESSTSSGSKKKKSSSAKSASSKSSGSKSSKSKSSGSKSSGSKGHKSGSVPIDLADGAASWDAATQLTIDGAVLDIDLDDGESAFTVSIEDETLTLAPQQAGARWRIGASALSALSDYGVRSLSLTLGDDMWTLEIEPAQADETVDEEDGDDKQEQNTVWLLDEGGWSIQAAGCIVRMTVPEV